MDIPTISLFSGILVLLAAAALSVRSLRKHIDYGADPAILDAFRNRIRVWWILFGLLACVFFVGPLATTLFFFALSVIVLREYITLTPKSPADHRTLFALYLLLPPMQFALVAVNPDWFRQWTGVTPFQIFSILLPVCLFLILPCMMAVSGDPKRFLERTAKLQLGMMICVYSMSYAPALLTIDLPRFADAKTVQEAELAPVINKGLEGTVIETFTAPPDAAKAEYQPTAMTAAANQTAAETDNAALPPLFRIIPLMDGKHFQLLVFFVVIVQFGDVFQYLWSHISRRHVVAEKINATKTWEGVFGGAVTAALLAVALWYFTPFPKWWQAALAGIAVSLMGFAGNMTMSAIKRDRGVSGYGSLIQGHSGFLDRVDSLCFAAPVFYFIVLYCGRG
ncbi:MAG: phosphatidate cytidylyltransferase [Planctomycetaceae bacterium]|jgi:phosphatidate cytidylyltransferase|nr:phosphatidate cytidylyltransferase [Planctomycetaceae bacterium]